MSFWAYILKNEVSGKLYAGHTSDLERRIQEHNDKERVGKRYTGKHDGKWELIYSEKYATRSEAIKREKFFKSGQGRAWIKTGVCMGSGRR